MKGPIDLFPTEDNWITHMGLSFPGERVVYRGKDLFHELKHLSWMQLYLYGITGRIFTAQQSKLFEGMWSLCTSYPDPRLWNNRIGSLAGTARSTGILGISAAVAISEASIYGGRPNSRSINFLIRTKNSLDQGKGLQEIIEEELKKHRVIYGYGRPIANRGDERIAPMLKLAKELNLADGPYTQIAFEVEKILLQGRWRMRMNVTGLCAALSANQGLSEREHFLFTTPCFTAGIMPCFIEASERQEGTFLPIRCGRIHYQGVPKRKWTPTVQQTLADTSANGL